ncbi:unnamed protein product [Orchesella dallaii]|uniref:Uncharacterized protein n=1 Tax=Orchesella dallaii TaxID=48710 RepID=A0ABP1RCS8_9HEXA
MQNRHSSSSPVPLEDLLQVPLQVVRLEDLIREKSSSASPPRSNNDKNHADNRLCRSADSHVQKRPDSANTNDINSKSSSSTPCLFDCCSKTVPGTYGGQQFSKDVRFKTAALNLPDGSSFVVPVVDFGTEGKRDKNAFTKSKHPSVDSDRTASASPPPQTQTTPPLLPHKTTVSSPVVLGTVTEEPTRFEDFLLAQSCGGSNNSIVGENRIQRIGSSNKGTPQKSGSETLQLTFYNDSHKESEKEFRTQMKEQDVRYFENQQLQLSRVIRDPGPAQQQAVGNNSGNRSQPSSSNNTHSPHQNQNQYGNNIMGQLFAHPQLKLTSSIIKNLNNNNSTNRLTTTNNNINNSNGKTWEQIGLKISRCQKDDRRVVSVEDERNGEKVIDRRMAQEGEPRDNGEAEVLIERHLQAYLTSLKYVKPDSAENMKEPPEHRVRSITHGLSGIAPQATRALSPCEPAQITRIPNVRPPPTSPASTQHHLEAWQERAIARIPSRPYLRRNIPGEHTQQPMYPPPKRFRANNHNAVQSNRLILPRQQQINSSQYIPTNNSAIPNGDGDQNPTLRNQLMHCTNIRQQLQHPAAYHPSSTVVPSPQHSPIAQTQPHTQQQYHHHNQQQLQKYPNNNANHQQQLQESRMLVAAVAAGGEGLESNAYYERLRRYWEFYQRQELDWAKLTEYYQKYHFYPWDILSARDESIRQWKQQQQQQQQQYAGHQQHHVSLGQNNLQNNEGRPIEFENLTQQQQHQLALRAMNLAAANYANSKSHFVETSSSAPISIQNRIAGMDVSPPSTSPLPVQVQNKYNHNSQQLQQLQQYHQRHGGLQQQQHHQHNQRLRYSQEQQQQQQQKAQQVVLMANQKLQNSANYFSAYNQLAAAAAAIASTVSTPQNQTRSRDSGNCAPVVIIDDEKDAEQEEIPVPVNIHRQTLELAMKNNFRNSSNSGSASNNATQSAFVTQQPHRNNVVSVRKAIAAQSQPQPIIPLTVPNHPQHQRPRPKNGTNNGPGNGAMNMAKESQTSGSSSPNASLHPPSVIRRLRIVQQRPPGSYSPSSSTMTIQQRNSNQTRTSSQNSRENIDNMQPIPLVLQKNSQYPREYAQGNNTGGNGNRIELESNGASKRNNNGDSINQNQHSPIPMVAGEEEVVTSVSPSAILSNYDDMPGGEDENTDERDTYNINANPETGRGGSWQYDHVVLLDRAKY